MTSSADLRPDLGTAEGRGSVEVRGLSVSLGGRAVLADVSFRVARGGLTAVVGPSGCGKSTLLRVLAGLAVAGTVVDGGAVRLPHGDDGRPDAAWMPQGDSLLPWRRTLGNVALGAQVSGASRRDATDAARGLLDRFGLAGFERSWPHELSGGMRQRAALARTVLAGRQVLLLDEPFGALDPITRRDMNGWLAAHREEGVLGDGAAVVLVTHDVDEAVALADHVVVLSPRPGRVVALVDVAALGHDASRRVVLASLG